MQKAIDKLAAERDALAANICGLHPYPPELCCMSEAPVLLSRICSAWRTISLSTPRLWARLHVVEPTDDHNFASTLLEEKQTQRLETMNAWLGRSGQLPLSISLECGHTPVDTPTHPNRFLQALISFAPRWEHISFATPTTTLETLFTLTEADVPALKSVRLPLPAQQYAHLHQEQSTDWRLFRMLRGSEISTFSIVLSHFMSRVEEFPLRWNQLTSLSITGFPWDASSSHMTLETLSKCPSLQICKLMVYDAEMQEANPGPIVKLQFLHALELRCSKFTFAPFLSQISLPALRTFLLRGSPDYSPEGQIQELDPASQESLSYFFSASTCLESLEMDNMFGKSSLIQEISIDQSNSISDAAILQFITARMASGALTMLKRAEFHFTRTLECDILPILQSFIETGLNVSIKHRKPLPLRFSPWRGLVDAPMVGFWNDQTPTS
ncbi:hypothetical protein C8R44DRAFT_957381 [Mycena epipterygia]|nr:hypothetical protein C8R44DRAFT_957381 [Mycena epipterygia]